MDQSYLTKITPAIQQFYPYIFSSVDFIVDKNKPRVIDLNSIAGSLGYCQSLDKVDDHNPFAYFLAHLPNGSSPQENMDLVKKQQHYEQIMLNIHTRDVLTQLDHLDYVLVMGGNNDVVWRDTTPSECLVFLERLFHIIEASNVKVIGLEIAPVTCAHHLVQKIKDTNHGLHELGKKMTIPIISLYDDLANSSKEGLKKEYDSGDGEHLSVEGYHKIGDIIYESYIKNLIKSL